MAEAVRTTCPYCGVGCGLLVMPNGDGGYVVKGDPDHPANFGRLCSKGSALSETLSDEGRLLHPVVDGEQADWNMALDRVADTFKTAIVEHGPDAVAFYVSGQLMTEAYYVANKLMKGFIGSANIDTNSRLCMASSVAGHKRAFGSDTVPGNYEDFDLADLVVLVGSNLAWCHPVLYQRLSAAKKEHGTKVVVIDPRKTATCDLADLHLALKPGSDVMLFNALLLHLAEVRRMDLDFVNAHTDGLDEALRLAREDAPNLAVVAEACGMSRMDLAKFFELFSATNKTVTVYSQGVNQSSRGTDKVNAILNCHLLTGRIGKPGCGPFSVTGQPNAMGGREVGGLANTLAAHMDFDDVSIDRIGRFWGAPNIATTPGLKAVDMFEAVRDGQIKAIWIMATNPAVSMPNAGRVHEALKACPFVVVSDCVGETDTARYADVLLPSTTWGERDGTVTNSERCISRQRPFKAVPGAAREDWSIICDVAGRLGFGEAFAFDCPAEIFAEHAALSAFENDGVRDFDLSGLADMDVAAYDALQPIQWPVQGGGGRERLFADGEFFTPQGKANFVAMRHSPPAMETGGTYPFVLNTGRVRDQWHTMTRTGLSPRLSAHTEEPFLGVHPGDAKALNMKDGDIAKVSSLHGEACLRVLIDPGQRPGEVFAPIHWSRMNTANSGVGGICNTVTDPVSGQPEMKFTPVHIERLAVTWHALVVSRDDVTLDGAMYWARVQGRAHQRVIAAGKGNGETALNALKAKLGEGEWIEYADPARGRVHAAVVKNGQLVAAAFFSPQNVFPDRFWLDGLFDANDFSSGARQAILAGRAPGTQAEMGRVICSCMGVGVNAIVRVLEDGHAIDVESLGVVLGAGISCGSCRPELQSLVGDIIRVRNAPKVRSA
ncbi:MAG: molybdopterin-dependent oxidoreductase [Rhodospirillales bacterium]|nr:molybdopterin-dependent oxidoreductase [Rhodospirillales bacterium]